MIFFTQFSLQHKMCTSDDGGRKNPLTMYTQFSMLNLQFLSSETIDILCLNFFLSEERKAEEENTQKNK